MPLKFGQAGAGELDLGRCLSKYLHAGTVISFPPVGSEFPGRGWGRPCAGFEFSNTPRTGRIAWSTIKRRRWKAQDTCQ
jgi:hypothetical protein